MTRHTAGNTSQTSKHDIIAALCAWFDREARDLPWRKHRTGYSALVSEFMLQQTQVVRVVDRYRQFIRTFPTVRSLAKAQEEQVLQHWQGLGYYRRARNLHASAKIIVDEFDGRVPSTTVQLLKLPGIGRYTAGAIASMAFNAREPVVDGNVQRVLLRVSASRATGMHAHAKAWRDAQQLVEVAPLPAVLNESLMELGATICLPSPQKPRCEACPIASLCRSRIRGLQHVIPPSKPRAKPRVVHHHAVVVMRGPSPLIAVERRSQAGMWAGMWQVPTIESDSPLTIRELATTLHERLDHMPVRIDGELRRHGSFVHATTHRSIRFHVYTGRSRERKGVWRTRESAFALPMSNAQRKVLALVFHGCDTDAGSLKKIIGKPPPPMASAL